MQKFFFVAERTSVNRGCTETHRELIQITAESFRRADQWICSNYKGWTHWHTDAPQQELFNATNFSAFIA